MNELEQLEQEIQREVFFCTSCEKDVHTVPAEGVLAQSLRACEECGVSFFMDLTKPPRYDQGDESCPAGGGK